MFKHLACCLVVSLLVLLQPAADCRIITPPSHISIAANSSYVQLYQFGMFAKSDPLLFVSLYPSNGDAFAQFKLSVTAPNEHASQVPFQLVFASYRNLESRFLRNDDGSLVCDGETGTLVPLDEKYNQTDIFFSHKQVPAAFQSQFEVHKSDYYVAILVKCPESHRVELTLEGQLQFMNPYGHLEGHMFGLLPFTALLSILYLSVSCVWIFFLIRYRRDLLSLQVFITLVLTVSMIETICAHVDLFLENTFGFRSPFVVVLLGLLTLTKKMVARILVLLACQGYGTISTILVPSMKWKIGIYSFIFFVASAGHELFKYLYYLNAINSTWLSFSVFPIGIIDGGFYAWIFVSLSNTIQQLVDKKQDAKLKLFNKLMTILIVCVIASAVFISLQLIYSLTRMVYLYWSLFWVFDGFWLGGFFAALVAIMALFRPSENNRLYAIAEQLPSDPDAELEQQDVDDHTDQDDNFEVEIEPSADTALSEPTLSHASEPQPSISKSENL